MTPLHAQARVLAEAGIKVFPCVVDGKQPATTNGFKDASLDLEQIDAWWNEADYNIGVCPEDAGWCVIDLDPGGEPHWVALLAENGAHAPTYEVETPRGGRHLYFSGSLPPSASKLGSHIDTRGRGSYVLVPPSVVGGKPYTVLHDRELGTVPDWIAPRLAATDRHFEASTDELDSPSSLARGRDILLRSIQRGSVSIMGAGGNTRLYQILAELRSLGVSRERSVRELLDSGWNDACKPPWSTEELEETARNVEKYAQNDAGAWNVGSAEEAFGKTEAFREAMKAQAARVSRYKIWSRQDFADEPPPKWIVPELIPDDSIVLWVGASQSFKSFILMDVLLSVATGKQTFGVAPEQGVALYGALEDRRGVGSTRTNAWAIAHDLADDKLPNWGVCSVPTINMPGDWEDWLAQITEWLGDRKLRLIAIDTAGKTLSQLNENDSATVRQFWDVCDKLREVFGCTVIAVHHSGKDSERGARGSSAWLADFDSVIEVTRPSKSEIAVEVAVRKHKNAPEGKRWTFKGVPLANSLVFEQSTTAEHAAVLEAGDFFAPSKVGKILGEKGAHDRTKALTTPDVWHALGGMLGDEKGVKQLEKMGKTKLSGYCDNDGGVLWWWYNPEPGGTA